MNEHGGQPGTTGDASDPPGPAALEITDLGHAYVPAQWVFRHLSVSIAAGSILAILAPNGRGKSTLLNVLSGSLTPTEGSVTRRGRTGFVPQLFQPGFPYTVLDMVLMGRARQVRLFAMPSRADEQIALAALERMGIGDLAPRPFDQLSGGQRQLVILARAIASEADILVLDEPTSALDLGNQALVLDHIGRLAQDQGMTVAFSTHHPHHAQAIADTALLMLGPEAWVSGPAGDVMTQSNLEALYQVPMREAVVNLDDGPLGLWVPLPRRRPGAQMLSPPRSSRSRP